MRKIEFTPEALGIMTLEQRDRIRQLFDDGSIVHSVRASVDLSLPTGYIYVIIQYSPGEPIHGGIDPEGSMST